MTTGPRRALPMCRLVERRNGNNVQLVGKLGESQVVVVASGTTSDGTRLYSMYLSELEPVNSGERKIGSAASSRQLAEMQFTRRP